MMRNILRGAALAALIAFASVALYLGAAKLNAPKPMPAHTARVCAMEEDGSLIDCQTGKALDYVRAPGAKMGEWK